MTEKKKNDPCWNLFNANAIEVCLAIKPGSRILEIGCAEANWLTPMAQVRTDCYFYGIDARETKRPGAAVVHGDVLFHNFEPHFFDLVVLVSTLEHIGLGYYGDNVVPDGDRLCLKRVKQWLKPGGILYFDVPYYKNFHATTTKDCYVYDDARLNQYRDDDDWIEIKRLYGVVDEDPPIVRYDPPIFAPDTPDVLERAPKFVVACWWRSPRHVEQGEHPGISAGTHSTGMDRRGRGGE